MALKPEQIEEKTEVKRYKIQHPISAYTFPVEARIQKVQFSNTHICVELADGRALSIPLQWIPTLYQAPPEERKKYKLNNDRTALIWDPDQCTINDELRIEDYLVTHSKP
ncbi:MAG: DUF2442 domain-containing protein [bacterium]|nr:DUF2442 domain-containing protein [bacterium]